jgi:Regulator of chromosome condensation (RCC1) repeat
MMAATYGSKGLVRSWPVMALRRFTAACLLAVLALAAVQAGGGPSQARAADPIQASSISAGAGSVHTCAIRTSGQAVCWGGNFGGQLGDGTETKRLNPTAVSSLNDATAISAGNAHTCAIRTSGQAVCWGANSSGVVGDGTETTRLTPVNVSGLTDATAISAGFSHTCAIRTSDQAVCWGTNSLGQLGDGTEENRLVPALVVEAGVPEPPETCATNQALCPPPVEQPVMPIAQPPGEGGLKTADVATARQRCIAKATSGFNKAMKAAKRKKGKARVRAMKAARKAKQQKVAQCKA